MMFPSTQLHWGGMSADTSIYLQRSVGDERFDESSGQWRIFSKLGAGYVIMLPSFFDYVSFSHLLVLKAIKKRSVEGVIGSTFVVVIMSKSVHPRSQR